MRDDQELAMYRAMEEGKLEILLDTSRREAGISESFYSLEKALEEDAVFRVEVLNSDSRISTDSSVFDPLRGVYEIREVFLRQDSLYSYTKGR